MKTNTELSNLIQELKKQASDKKINLWKRLASDLEKPTRQRKVINLNKINLLTKENETIVIPGKVLGTGEIDHKVTIAALTFSNSAEEKMKKVNCNVFKLDEFVKNNPKPKNVRILI